MKKNFRTIVAFMAIAAMLMTGMTACGSKDASANESFILGATGPLTGDASSYGISVNQGAQIALDEINENGGLNGISYTLIFKDDKADAAEAGSGYDSLMDEGMQISIGSVTSGSCDAFAARALEDNVFFITPSASAANVIADRPNAFRVCFGDPDQGILAARQLSADYDNIGCIYDTSDTYSTGIFEAFEAEMAALHTEFTLRTFDQDNNKDFSAQIEALKDCDVIFCPFYYTEGGLVARACAAKELDEVVIFGCDGFDGVASQIDETIKNPIMYITPFDAESTDEMVVSFVEKYEKAYGTTPDQFAADAYDAVYTVFYSMQAAGIDSAEISASDLCDAVVAAITDSSFSYAGLTGVMSWNEDGSCNKIPVIKVLEH